MSVQKGVGARKGEDRGIGLQQLLDFVKTNEGEMTIISGNGKVIFKSNKIIETEIAGRWDGTIVEVKLNRDQKSYYKMKGEEVVF